MLPSTPAKPTGLEYIGLLTGTQSVYNSTGSSFSTSYEWSMEPPEAGNLTVSENGLDCTVDWVPTFTGQAVLKVRGINDCGESDFSELLTVTVANTFGLAENESGLGIIVYPNPSSGNFRIELTVDKSTTAKLMLFNAAGEPVWGPVEVEISHKLSLPFSLESLSEGIYLLQVETIKGISNCKIMLN